jgi:hypothetical protein
VTRGSSVGRIGAHSLGSEAVVHPNEGSRNSPWSRVGSCALAELSGLTLQPASEMGRLMSSPWPSTESTALWQEPG